MKEIIYTCDRCRQKIDGNPSKIHVDSLLTELPDQETERQVPPPVYPELQDLDLCKDCTDFFVSLIKRHCRKGHSPCGSVD